MLLGASALGYRGGISRSPKKVAAARRNLEIANRMKRLYHPARAAQGPDPPPAAAKPVGAVTAPGLTGN